MDMFRTHVLICISFCSTMTCGMLVPVGKKISRSPVTTSLVHKKYNTSDNNDTYTGGIQITYKNKPVFSSQKVTQNIKNMVRGCNKSTCTCLAPYIFLEDQDNKVNIPLLEAYNKYVSHKKDVRDIATMYKNYPFLIQELEKSTKSCPHAQLCALKIMAKEFALRSVAPTVLGGITYAFAGDATFLHTLATAIGVIGTGIYAIVPFAGLCTTEIPATRKEKAMTNYLIHENIKIKHSIDACINQIKKMKQERKENE